MNFVISILVVIFFCTSFLKGETRCCGDRVAKIENTVSKNIDALESLSYSKELRIHFCHHSETPGNESSGERHLCIGCPHSPFVDFSSKFFSFSAFEMKDNFFEKDQLFLGPYLEGPFEPPKAISV
ncbi:MAG: hypothetical protein KDD61_06410 [Bdellovibrionales bacterium]|nr:hypothetical protein [Bdellovibrionales bacterium]